MKRIEVAKTAGFCFGVNRAVEMTYKLVDSGKKVATFGPLIHNPVVIEDLEKKGVRVINSPIEASADTTVVVRTHGVGASVYRSLEATGADICDATCPFVKKIHRIVGKNSSPGVGTLRAADDDHHIDALRQLGSLFLPILRSITYCIKNICDFSACDVVGVTAGASTPACIIKEVLCNMSEILNEQSKELEEGAVERKTDVAEAAAGELEESAASAQPAEEVPSEEADEQDFSKALEESLNSMNNDQKVTGIVMGFSPTEIQVDIGRKHAGYVPMDAPAVTPTTSQAEKSIFLTSAARSTR